MNSGSMTNSRISRTTTNHVDIHRKEKGKRGKQDQRRGLGQGLGQGQRGHRSTNSGTTADEYLTLDSTDGLSKWDLYQRLQNDYRDFDRLERLATRNRKREQAMHRIINLDFEEEDDDSMYPSTGHFYRKNYKGENDSNIEGGERGNDGEEGEERGEGDEGGKGGNAGKSGKGGKGGRRG